MYLIECTKLQIVRVILQDYLYSFSYFSYYPLYKGLSVAAVATEDVATPTLKR